MNSKILFRRRTYDRPPMHPLMPAPRAVIFDLDGTLVDSFGIVLFAWNESVGRILERTFELHELMARFGPTELAMVRREIPLDCADDACRNFMRAYESDHARLAKVFDGIPQLLDALRDACMPLGLMTGKGRDTCDVTLAKLGWTDRFASVITGDECPKPKPAPDGVLQVARELGVPPSQCVFIGDSPADIGAGNAAGMKTIWAGWHPVYEEEIAQLQPTLIARSPDDVARFLGLHSSPRTRGEAG